MLFDIEENILGRSCQTTGGVKMDFWELKSDLPQNLWSIFLTEYH